MKTAPFGHPRENHCYKRFASCSDLQQSASALAFASSNIIQSGAKATSVHTVSQHQCRDPMHVYADRSK